MKSSKFLKPTKQFASSGLLQNMSSKNEYSGFSIEELNVKAAKYKRIQMGVMIMSFAFSAIIAIASYTKGSDIGYQIIPILLLAGTVYPLLTFGNIRKKIQKEISTRNS